MTGNASVPAACWLGMTCTATDGPAGLRPVDYPRAPLAAHEVRIAVDATGVNFVDVLLTRGTYQFKPPLPFVPGLEACGRVIECGAAVSGIREGDRVLVNVATGAFATEVVAPVAQVWPAPAGFSDVEAACFRVAAHTAWYALAERGNVQPGETVLVLGAGGGLGLAAVEIARLLGATVIAAASSVPKLGAARQAGAHHGVDYSTEPLGPQVKALAPQGVDVVFDPVGGDLFEQSVRLCAWGGRVLIAGFASGTIGRVAANLPLLKGASVLGVRAGEAVRRDPAVATRSRETLLAWAEEGRLRPRVSETYPLTAASRALETLERREAVGRVALVTSR